MIYVCDKCRFVFERIGKVDICPNCGKDAIREADEIVKLKQQNDIKHHIHEN